MPDTTIDRWHMFNIVNREVNRVTALFVCLFLAMQVGTWLGLSALHINGNAIVEGFAAWLMLLVVRVSDKLAEWETAQMPPQLPVEPLVPLETRVRDLLSRGKRLEAIRDIRAEKQISLKDAQEYVNNLTMEGERSASPPPGE
jgi:hypothetical protein